MAKELQRAHRVQPLLTFQESFLQLIPARSISSAKCLQYVLQTRDAMLSTTMQAFMEQFDVPSILNHLNYKYHTVS